MIGLFYSVQLFYGGLQTKKFCSRLKGDQRSYRPSLDSGGPGAQASILIRALTHVQLPSKKIALMCVDTHWSDGFLKCLVRMNCFDFPRDELRVKLLERTFENWFSFRNGMDFIKPMKQLKHFSASNPLCYYI